MTDPILIETAEAARILGISKQLVYKLCDEEKLRSRYQGRKRLVFYASCVDYAEGLPSERESA